LDVWGVDVATSDFVVSTDPGVEINEKVYEQIEEKISELINNAVTYAISQSLKGAINIRNKH
jgi:two-component sensor histidine kinase